MRTDEEILYDCYHQLYEKCLTKNKKVTPSKDKPVINSIAQKSSKLLGFISGPGSVPIDIDKNVMSAKGLYLQYAHIKGRNPGIIDPVLDITMEKMIKAVCGHEADMIREIRLQETGGNRIDIEDYFKDRKNINLLGCHSARKIILEFIRSMTDPVGYVHRFYITDTGKKYHRKGCPFCHGRSLTATTSLMVRNQNLNPCKCLTDIKSIEDEEAICMTAFIDESIHPTLWDTDGNKGMIGSYSYIICRGCLENETEITENNRVTEGVDFIGEEKHVERITEAAVGKVLLSLAYDYGFFGRVYIYTDNRTVVTHWRDSVKNKRIAELFTRVEVSYISRKRNTKADKLGRKRMLLDMPSVTYNEIVKELARVKVLERQIEELESEKAFTTEIPEVIVAKTVKVC